MSYDRVATAWASEALKEIKLLKVHINEQRILNEALIAAIVEVAESQRVLRGHSVGVILNRALNKIKASRKPKETDKG